MSGGTLTQLNKSLELTLRDGLDGLEDFTLQMAYASTGAQFKILPVDDSSTGVAETNIAGLTLVDTATPEPATHIKRQA